MVDNPPAFPALTSEDEFSGMTMLDYFAGQALAGLLASSATYGGKTDNRAALAADAYAHASAMLAERAK